MSVVINIDFLSTTLEDHLSIFKGLRKHKQANSTHLFNIVDKLINLKNFSLSFTNLTTGRSECTL